MHSYCIYRKDTVAFLDTVGAILKLNGLQDEVYHEVRDNEMSIFSCLFKHLVLLLAGVLSAFSLRNGISCRAERGKIDPIH